MLSQTGRRTPSLVYRNAKKALSKGYTRQYAATAAAPLTEPLDEFHPSQHGTKGFDSVRVSTLENGIKVVSMETHVPVARVAIITKAGSRYETPNNLGITHMLRNAAIMSSKERSALHIVRETAQNGASLEVCTSREHFSYLGNMMSDKVPSMIENIAAAISSPLFYPWEMKESADLTKLDKAALKENMQASTLELLHSAAFRSGLGNSLYCPDDRIGSYTPEEMSDFQKSHFNGERMAIVGLGIAHSLLVDQASRAFKGLARGGAVETPKQAYYGGEIRQRSGGKMVHIAVATEGVGLMHKDFLALGLLQRILGVSPFIKWGSHTVSSRINKAIVDVTNSSFVASTLNIGYADTGLFGFYAVAEPKQARQVLKAIVGQFGSVAKGNVKGEELERAKNQLKAAVLMSAENKDALVEDMVYQTFCKGGYTAPAESMKAIDSVTIENVISVAKRLFSGKPSMACIGDTANAPYLDELF